MEGGRTYEARQTVATRQWPPGKRGDGGPQLGENNTAIKKLPLTRLAASVGLRETSGKVEICDLSFSFSPLFILILSLVANSWANIGFLISNMHIERYLVIYDCKIRI